MLGKLLEIEGAFVDLARSGAEALEIADAEKIRPHHFRHLDAGDGWLSTAERTSQAAANGEGAGSRVNRIRPPG